MRMLDYSLTAEGTGMSAIADLANNSDDKNND